MAGKIIPVEVTIRLIKYAMDHSIAGPARSPHLAAKTIKNNWTC